MEPSEIATRQPGTRTEDVEQEDPFVGRIVDRRYRVIRRLGHGGMGAVYEAEHLSLETKVAIKVLQGSLATNEKYRKRFLREAKAASAIESINIVRSTDFGITEDGLPYFVMEFMDGQDLEQCLAGGLRMEWSRFEPVLRQITGAVGAAHKRGVIHRDIKPSNCFLCKTDDWPPVVKVLDFGIAKINAAIADGETPVATLETLTATNELFGTIAYMAPELIEGNPADTRSDIYALGVLMFRTLTGRLPFTSPNVYKVLQQHVSTPVPSLRTLASEIPATVESVVFRALAKLPEHRYQTVAELEAALRAAGEGVIEPSAAALSGHTQAVTREAAAETSLSGDPALAITTPNAGGVTQRIDDPGSLASARIRARRFSPLAVLGVALAALGGIAALFAFVDSPATEHASTATEFAEPPTATMKPSSIGRAAPTATATGTEAHAPDGVTKPDATGANAPKPAATGATEPEPPTVSPPSGSAKPRADARKQTSGAPKAKATTIDELAGKRCPDTIGERFTIEGVLNGEGKYIDPTVAGGSKTGRDCIEAFIRARSFGTGRSMQPHTVRLAPG